MLFDDLSHAVAYVHFSVANSCVGAFQRLAASGLPPLSGQYLEGIPPAVYLHGEKYPLGAILLGTRPPELLPWLGSPTVQADIPRCGPKEGGDTRFWLRPFFLFPGCCRTLKKLSCVICKLLSDKLSPSSCRDQSAKTQEVPTEGHYVNTPVLNELVVFNAATVYTYLTYILVHTVCRPGAGYCLIFLFAHTSHFIAYYLVLNCKYNSGHVMDLVVKA